MGHPRRIKLRAHHQLSRETIVEEILQKKFTLGIKQLLGLDVQFKRDYPEEETDVKFATSTVVTGRFYFN